MPEKIDYLILAATEGEISYIVSRLLSSRREEVRFFRTTRGKLYEKEIVLVSTGLGITNAAMVTCILLENLDVGTLVSVGIAGSYDGQKVKLGDVVIAEEEVYADTGIKYDQSYDPLDNIGIPLFEKEGRRYFNRWPVDSSLLKIAKQNSDNLAGNRDFSVHFGKILTVCAVSGSPARASDLKERYRGLCENMEGAAIAQVAVAYGVEYFECRGISNIAGTRDRKEWKVEEASTNSQMVLTDLISRS